MLVRGVRGGHLTLSNGIGGAIKLAIACADSPENQDFGNLHGALARTQTR